jgi:hypothetical protein
VHLLGEIEHVPIAEVVSVCCQGSQGLIQWLPDNASLDDRERERLTVSVATLPCRPQVEVRAPVVTVFCIGPEVAVGVCVPSDGLEPVPRTEHLSTVVEVSGYDCQQPVAGRRYPWPPPDLIGRDIDA